MPTQLNHSTKTFLQVFVFFLVLMFLSLNSFAASADGRWELGIGDPTILGWTTVVIYLVVAIRCVFKAIASRSLGGNYHYWLILSLFFLMLGINKQLDLQSWLTQTLKDISIEHGWYAQRRGLQIAFVVTIGFGMLLATFSLRLFLVNIWHRHKLLWVGMIMLCGFVLIRAASFHHVDIAIGSSVLGIKLNVILEVSALLIILVGTYVKHQVSDYKMTRLSEINPIVQIDKEGDIARCPQCGKQAVATTLHNRKFKCRRCGFFYKIHVSGHDDT